jgi:hypothetical protein
MNASEVAEATLRLDGAKHATAVAEPFRLRTF